MVALKESLWSCSEMRKAALNVGPGSGSWAGCETRGLGSESCVLVESLPDLLLLVRFAMREEASGRACGGKANQDSKASDKKRKHTLIETRPLAEAACLQSQVPGIPISDHPGLRRGATFVGKTSHPNHPTRCAYEYYYTEHRWYLVGV